MLNQIKKTRKNEKGFTIIEVLIVLAIAGLIIAIVLFAVPALQRNGRNTGIKSDAGQLAGYIGDFAGNYDGAKPAVITGAADGTVTLKDSPTGTKVTTGKIQGSTTVSTPAAAPASPAAGNLYVILNKSCDGGTSTRAISIVYALEGSGGTLVSKCLDA